MSDKETEITDKKGVDRYVETPGMIYTKIPAIIEEMEAVEKKKNPDGPVKYAYRRIDDFMNALNPLLAKHRVTIVPKALKHDIHRYQTSSGAWMNSVVMQIQYRFYAEDGSYIETVTVGEAFDSGDKASNKAQSVALKYAIMQTFMVPTEDIDDPDDHAPKLPPPGELGKAYKPQAPREEPKAKTVSQLREPGKPMKWEPTTAQLKRLFTLAEHAKWTEANLKGYLKECMNVDSTKDLNLEQYKYLCDAILQKSTPYEKARNMPHVYKETP